VTQARWIKRVVKPIAFVASLGPLGWLVRDILTGHLGANPVERITHFTGLTALTFLLITLGVTPARRLLGLSGLVQLRRMLGLYAFFYALLHFTIYGLDRTLFEGTGLSLAAIGEDIGKRPYITVGFTAFVILCGLAATSTNGMVRRLGGKRWKRLHQLVYVAGALGVLHFLWLVKADVRQPTAYGLALVALLGFRLVRERTRSRSARSGATNRPAPIALSPESAEAP
jgi:sulfoxide reductase heme-binding subunit YedZ